MRPSVKAVGLNLMTEMLHDSENTFYKIIPCSMTYESVTARISTLTMTIDQKWRANFIGFIKLRKKIGKVRCFRFLLFICYLL